MKYYLIAGEASGDLHGGNLMKAIRQLDDRASFRFWGGDKMQAVEDNLVVHYRDMAFMGFVEVIKHLKTIFGYFKKCKADILRYKPDVLILIDYPGFNLRMAKWAHKQGIKVAYYISPQLWAWHKSRITQVKKYVDRMMCILPFEKTFYAENGMDVAFVGHPLLDEITAFKERDVPELEDLSGKRIIALLPGSRKQEISRMLPVMLEAVSLLRSSANVFVIAAAPNIDHSFYRDIVDPFEFPLHIIRNRTYDILSKAEGAIVSSGTATLETALFGVPQVVCYIGNAISVSIAKKIVSIDFISLVNLIMEKRVVEELIQKDCTAENIAYFLSKAIGENRSQMLQDYNQLRTLLGNQGASQNAAREIIKLISNKDVSD